MRLKVMIAAEDRTLCKNLMDMFCSAYTNLEVIGTAQDAETLIRSAREMRADAIFFSLSLPGLVETDCVRQVKRYKQICNFTAILEDNSETALRRALELQVDDVLIMPVTSQMLRGSAERAARNNEEKRDDGALLDHIKISEQLFFDRAIFELDQTSRIDVINEKFLLHFVKGLFRVLLIRSDFKDPVSKPFYDDFPMRQTAMRLVRRYLGDLCSEFCVRYCANGVMILINYPVGSDKEVVEQINAIFPELYQQVKEQDGHEITICVGRAYPHIWQIRNSREDAYSADWSRLEKGGGQLCFWTGNHLLLEQYEEKIDRLYERTHRACIILDKNEFDRCTEEIFSLPNSMLKHGKVHQWISWTIELFFELNGILLFGPDESLREKYFIRTKLLYNKTFVEYKRCFQEYFDDLFVRANNISESKSIKPVRIAMQYVREHFSEQIRVEDVAQKVNLSVAYFSTLFKKQTGANFTKYVTDYRMGVAKKMLQETDMTIGEIADALGFADQRYFSKIFKRTVGKSPRDFRIAKN